MYRVLVVDDEPKVRRGLRQLIPQLDSEWAVVGEAKNGMEALDMVKRELPDAVITDIRMPQMNGLDLLSALKDYPLHVVILSGYGYFEYAQTAVKFGAFDYLLKPLKPEEIRSCLYRLKQQKQTLLSEPRRSGDPLHAKLWKDWLLGVEEADDYRERLEKLLPEAVSSFQLLAIEIDGFDELITDDQWGDRQLVLFAVRNIVQEIALTTERFDAYFLFSNGARLYFLVANGAQSQHICRRMIEEIKRWVKISISIGLSGETERFDQLPQLIKQAQEALLNKWVYGEGAVHAFYGARATNDTVLGYPDDLERELIKAIQGCQEETAKELLKRFPEYVKEMNVTFQVCKSYCTQLLASIIRYAHNQNLSDFVLANIKPIDLLHRNFTLDQFLNYMNELVASCIASLKWSKLRKISRVMDHALAFIRDNYHHDLSLDEVAAKAETSPSYFSSIFKQETGSSFVEYVTRLRIEKAKSLMKEPSLRLYEISKMVGYQDEKYFSRLFKKVTGASPAEYRQFFCRKEET